MMGTSRLVVSCIAVLAAACGADNRLDPADLELRDLLGIAPGAAGAWDGGQRAAARRVIEDGLRQAASPPIRASAGGDAVTDRQISSTLAAVDADRAGHAAGALGLVRVAPGRGEVVVTPRAATIERHATPPVEIRLAGWDAEPGWAQLPARGPEVLSALAADAGHTGGPVVVTPAPRLATVAGYLPATTTDPARLVINPVLLAALEPVAAGSDGSAGAAPVAVQRSTVRSASPARVVATGHPSAIAATGGGNPYSFYGSVAECAAAQRTRCDACLADRSCTAVTRGDGNAECTTLGANGGRGYFLICIDLALAIDAVSSCAATGAPSCARDTHASESISTLENNADFLDDAACGGALDGCLAELYGASKGDFPGPGSGGTTAPPPRHTSTDCSDACSSQDTNCELDPNCETDGPSCDESQSSGGACADSNGQSGCSGGDGGGGGGGGGCSGDSEDACGSQNASGCDNGDCSGNSGGGDCSSSGGGGDCGGGGGGGDCGGGGGGDCGGGGGDCNVAGKHHRTARGSVTPTVVWAFLPVPFAAMVRRRARRRRAVAEHAEATGEPPDGEVRS